MTSLTLILTPLLMLQASGETLQAVENDTPETWTLEYPRLIQPYVVDYRRCLSGQMRWVTGEPNFEMQHRDDIASCTEQFAEAQTQALKVLDGRSEYTSYTADDIREVFEHIGRIHIARGADLDNQFTAVLRRGQTRRADYNDDKPKGLVLELRDASVVKARTDATAAAAEAAYEAREARDVND